ncbi:MAG: hypothetical protein OCD76_18965 [Reichenbachiella sp.]
MKSIYKLLFALLLLHISCDDMTDEDLSSSDEKASFSSLEAGSGTSSPNGETGQDTDLSGQVTAGEWNDLTHWDFWSDLLVKEEFSEMPSYWNYYTNNRISLKLSNGASPVNNAKIEIRKDDVSIWIAKSDNHGLADLWVAPFQQDSSTDISSYNLLINDQMINHTIIPYTEGINEININPVAVSDKVELMFIVDATGSMGDELEFLKDDLTDIIEHVQTDNNSLDIYTSTVFYRDEGDQYITKHSDFTHQTESTVQFIQEQKADGGGDFPEAVHSALAKGIRDFQWSSDARTRLAFFILDAPPHYTPEVIADLQASSIIAAEKGIKIIPIVASGIDKETEFLMRFLSITSNGSYVFITNDSGIGGDHLEASVGQYEVEYLNHLIVRLINEYSE